MKVDAWYNDKTDEIMLALPVFLELETAIR